MNVKRSDQPRDRASIKSDVQRWMTRIVAEQRAKPPTLAKKFGVSASTLYRMLDPNDPFVPGLATITKIEDASGTPLSSDGLALYGFGEEEATRLEPDQTPAELKPSQSQGVWRINNRAIELAGYLVGDIVLVQLGAPPSSDDLVCAQVYDLRTGSADTVFRMYEPPYLTTRTLDRIAREKPLLVDGERVVVMGVVTKMMRLRSEDRDGFNAMDGTRKPFA